jgi:hypothetical protein
MQQFGQMQQVGQAPLAVAKRQQPLGNALSDQPGAKKRMNPWSSHNCR